MNSKKGIGTENEKEEKIVNRPQITSILIDECSSNTANHSLKSHSSSLIDQIDSKGSTHLLNDFSQIKKSLSPMYRSLCSLSDVDDPWKASSIGIKCINYKPVGSVFLTRRVLDLYVTDGKRKVDILYSYSKKNISKIKIPSIGSSIENCSFCDTITLDFDPDSTLFDLVMEVQIITQGACEERDSKLESEETNKKDNTNDDFDMQTTLKSSYDIKIQKRTNYESLEIGENKQTKLDIPENSKHLTEDLGNFKKYLR